MIRTVLTVLAATILLNTGYAQNKQDTETKLLVFSKTDGYRHASIPVGIRALREISEENGYLMDHTENANLFNSANLKQYDAVIFLNTTLDVFNEKQQEAFQGYIRNGGGYVGIHAASDTEFDWPWYGRLVGAYFDGHPKIQRATVRVKPTYPQNICPMHGTAPMNGTISETSSLISMYWPNWTRQPMKGERMEATTRLPGTMSLKEGVSSIPAAAIPMKAIQSLCFGNIF